MLCGGLWKVDKVRYRSSLLELKKLSPTFPKTVPEYFDKSVTPMSSIIHYSVIVHPVRSNMLSGGQIMQPNLTLLISF